MSASHAAAADDGAGFSYDFKIKEFITLEKKKSRFHEDFFSPFQIMSSETARWKE